MVGEAGVVILTSPIAGTDVDGGVDVMCQAVPRRLWPYPTRPAAVAERSSSAPPSA